MQLLLHPMMLPVTLPIVAGVICLVMPRKLERGRALAAIAGTAVTLLLTLKLFLAVRQGYVVEQVRLAPLINLRLDALSAFVLLGVALFGLLSAIYSYDYMSGRGRLPEYYACLLWTVGLSCGAVLANHLALLLVFWGMLGATLYMMIGIGGADASAAAKKTFIIVGASDCLLMLGIAIVWKLDGQLLMHQIGLGMTRTLACVAFLCFTAAAFAKAGAMPLHSWVPDCGEKAPVAVSAFLPASLDKLLGIYLLARTVNGLFATTQGARVFLMLIGAATVMCAVMMALVQHDLKRLLSYHAVSQVGYMVLGIASGTAIGIAGGLFHMLNNAMYKSCLFMCAGSVERQTGTTDLDKLGGLGRAMPMTFLSCLVAAMAISGMPPLNGFASKWMIYQGIVQGGNGTGPWPIWLVAAMFGSALTLASFAKVLHAVFLRKPTSADVAAKAVEVRPTMWAPPLFLAGLCVLFGVLWYGVPFRNIIEPAVGAPVRFSGIWLGGTATVLLVLAFAVGAVAYALSSARRPRACRTYIGGEDLAEADIPGEVSGADGRDVEVSGADFYRTVEDMTPFKAFYESARAKLFDVYDVGTNVLFYFVEALRAAHTGRLLSYLTWFLAGFLLIAWLLL